MTIAALRALLDNPAFLFACMILAQLASIYAQWHEAKVTGAQMSFMELLGYWPQLLIGLGTSVTAFIGLAETDMLNFASAIGIGGIVNKFSDLLATRRTKAITDSIPSETVHNARK